MLAYLDELVRVERPALAQDLLADGELADVMQRPPDANRLFDRFARVERAD